MEIYYQAKVTMMSAATSSLGILSFNNADHLKI